jgi:hypothetical protein
MAKLMRCHTPHWQGNTFVSTGTVLPDGDAGVIPIYFEAFTVGSPTEPESPEPESPTEPEPAPAEVKRGPGRPRKTAP